MPAEEEDQGQLAREYLSIAWDVDTLKKSIAEVAADWVRHETFNEPPFKPDLVEDLTEDDISLLADWIELGEQDRYAYWRTVFTEINLTVSWSDAQAMVSGLKSLLPERVPGAAAFFLLSEAYLSQADKKETMGEEEPQGGAEEEDAVLLAAMDDLLHAGNIPRTRRSIAHGPNVVRACAGLIALLKKHWRERGAQEKAIGLLGRWGISVSAFRIRDWRRRRYKI